jgi:hypothetical protein
MTTPQQAQYWAYALTLKSSAETVESLSRTISNARVDLNPHQVDAALFALCSPLSRGVILADEVGLGKTIEAALVISQRWAERRRKILVVVPAALRKQWQQELREKFFLPSLVMEGGARRRLLAEGKRNPFDLDDQVVVCSYPFAAACQDDVAAIPWDLVVIDEAHRLRNIYKAGSKTARTVAAAVQERQKLLLTATPLQNSLMELFGLVSVIDSHVFGDQISFREQFIRASDEPLRNRALKQRLASVCQRTLRKQVLEYVRFTQRVPVTQEFHPTDNEQQLYDSVSEYLRRETLYALPSGQRTLIELVLATMEKLEALFEELKDADNAYKRIYGMDKDEERFAAAVTQLTQRIGLDVGERTPAEVTQSLVRLLGKAQADAASLQKLRARVGELEEEVIEARQDIQFAEQSLAGLRVEAGVTSDEELGPVGERSQQKRLLASRLETVLQQIHQSGEGLSIDELEKEARELTPDQVGDKLSQLDTRLSDLASERDAKRDHRQSLLVHIQALDGSSKAAEAAERAEQLLAGIVPDAEQYLRLTIARLILEERMERYRQDNQTPVLRRAGELFAKLTLGSFSGLRDEVDENGQPVLLGVRPDRTEVGVKGMSDGARDQLFLALRLATIELQRDQQDPLPFVVDDILVGFDDERSKACLEVLAEFAQKTHVLVFTHHMMVAQAANGLGKGKGVYVHELGGTRGGDVTSGDAGEAR